MKDGERGLTKTHLKHYQDEISLILALVIWIIISFFLVSVLGPLRLEFIPVVMNGLTAATSIEVVAGVFLSRQLPMKMKIIFVGLIYIVLNLIGIAYLTLAMGNLNLAFKLCLFSFLITLFALPFLLIRLEQLSSQYLDM